MKLKDCIRHYCDLAFEKDGEMSLMATVSKLGSEHLAVKPDARTWSMEEILHHVGFWKQEYCRQGFGGGAPEWDFPKGDLDGIARALRTAHEQMCDCLEGCSEEDLANPIPTRFHGETAAHFFSVMAMHDISHAAQIRSVLRAAGMR